MSVLGDYYRKAVKSQVPAAVHFDLTYRCHQDCLHCYLPQAIRRGDGAGAELDTPQVKQVLDQLAAAGAFFLTLSGGEVFMRQDLLDIIAYARQQNFAVALMTSGLRTAETGVVRQLKDLGVLNIYLSLYSLNPAVHDHLTQTPGSWAAAWSTLENCRSQELPIVLNCLALGPNYADMWGLAEFVRREKLALKWDCDVVPRWDGQPHPPELILTSEQIEVLNREFNDSGALGKTAENLVLPPDLLGCAAGLSHCYLNPQAEVWPCLDVKWHCGKLLGAPDFCRIWENSPVMNKARFLQKEVVNSEFRLCHIYQDYVELPIPE
jgi:AdoMet-dependent heme synthase